MSERICISDMTLDALTAYIVGLGQPKFRAKQIFKWLKKTKLFRGFIIKLENRAMGKSDQIKRYEFLGLLLFVGVPLPGTGAWTGSLIASLLEVDIKKSSIAIFCGLIMATVIMCVVSYGVVGNLVH